jgi:anion-transporting  ArsA/GET3 family ATPase
MTGLSEMIRQTQVIVCCGSGGVGKTTTAAAIAMHAAATGKRVAVVTIDPAKRLADAFGLADGLTNEPTQVEMAQVESGGSGTLWALMLDPSTTFDDLIRTHAKSDEQAKRILANAFYRNIAGSLSGTQEYMAAEKLYQLHRDPRFDLVVVDTPPTRSALDFLSAPGRLTRFIDHKLFRLLMLPARSGLKVLNFAAQPVLRTIGKVVGGEVLADAIAFFQAFDGMEVGFRQRADEVMSLLHSPATQFVLVASARRDTVEEAQFFADRLQESSLAVGAVVINRLQPNFGDDAAPSLGRNPSAERKLLFNNLVELRQLAAAEEAVVAPLLKQVDTRLIHRVPLFDTDVHDRDGLQQIAKHLFASAVTSR